MSLGRSAGRTDTGRRRRHNEDSYVVRPPLFAVADGIGGAQAGEVASRLAAGVLDESDGAGGGEESLVELVQEANRRVYRRSTEDAALSGMGTTMTVALVDAAAGTVAVGHVGDSRAYRIRGGSLEQLTDDHSLVQELVRSGKLSQEEADVHPQRSVITRALGTDPDVDVDTFTVETEPGDLYLLCSDGLTDMVADREILELVEGGRHDLDGVARALVEAANRGGGEDNITVVVFEIATADAGDTVRLPAGAASGDGPDDEDTLSGLEALPAVDSAVISAEDVRDALAQQEAAEEAEQKPVEHERRRRRMRRHGAGGGSRWPALLVLLLAIAIVAALVAWGFLR